MSAPINAEPIVFDPEQRRKNLDLHGNKMPDVSCDCGWRGGAAELLGVDPDENSTLWCPACFSIGWVYE